MPLMKVDIFKCLCSPTLMVDKPDIVVMEKGSGIWIIEVKDWDLEHYSIQKGQWVLESDPKKPIIKSPFLQAERYKRNFFSLHSYQLAKRNLENPSVFGSIRVAVYFHVATTSRARSFQHHEAIGNKNIQYIETFGHDITDAQLKNFFSKPRLPIQLNEYDYLLRYLMPSEVSREKLNIVYTTKQKRLIISSPKKQKVQGVAGSGKSLVLAARAVNALERTKGRILILTFNITLINYLHDRISDVRGKYKRKDFDILSYHAFINAECNNLGVYLANEDNDKGNNKVSYFDNIYLFENVKHQIKQYDAIFIDEVQDFKYNWQKIIEKYFLKQGGELVLFGDEKQNVYGRELENKQMKTIIPGVWNKLTQSHRLSRKTTELAEQYQQYFFKDRYSIEAIQLSLDLDKVNGKDQLQYMYTNNAVSVLPYLLKFIETNVINTDDLVFIGNRKNSMRKIDLELRRMGYYTLPMFISEEEYNQISRQHHSLNNLIKQKEQELERSRKVGFWMQSGKIKLSTIHSFKGWESSNVFLILEPSSDHQESIDELIYTGLTRCKKNLFVINVNSMRLHTFFEQNRFLFHMFNDAEVPE